nr:hypothetical protein DBT41_10860 [Aerococcus urinae]
MLYSLLLVAVSLVPGAIGLAGAIYTGAAALLGAIFLIAAFRVWRAPAGDYKSAKQLFAYSILYLFLLFSVLLVEQGFGIALPLTL